MSHQPTCNAILLALRDGTPDESVCNCGGMWDLSITSQPAKQPDNQPAEDQPRRRRVRRSVRPYTELLERKFWETCVQVCIQSDDAWKAIEKADRALDAWRQRWIEKPAPEPAAEIPGYPIFPGARQSSENEPEDFQDFAPPAYNNAPKFAHRFEPVEGNRYCGNCGGGRYHAIHPQETPPDVK